MLSNTIMNIVAFKIILLNILLCFSLAVYSHNPEDFIISEIEQGQLTFENDQISTEYNAALKRLRIRRLSAMSWEKKFLVFTKSGFEHIIPKGLDHILFVLGLFLSFLNLFFFFKCNNSRCISPMILKIYIQRMT